MIVWWLEKIKSITTIFLYRPFMFILLALRCFQSLEIKCLCFWWGLVCWKQTVSIHIFGICFSILRVLTLDSLRFSLDLTRPRSLSVRTPPSLTDWPNILKPFNCLRPVLSFSLATSIHWFTQSYCEATNATTMLRLLLLYQFWLAEICICHKSHLTRDKTCDL